MATAGKPMTKSDVYKTLAERTGLDKKVVTVLFGQLTDLIRKELSKKGPGAFTLPGVAKMKVAIKPATKATKKPNPFKPGEMMDVKAKPASRKVKVIVMKKFKTGISG